MGTENGQRKYINIQEVIIFNLSPLEIDYCWGKAMEFPSVVSACRVLGATLLHLRLLADFLCSMLSPKVKSCDPQYVIAVDNDAVHRGGGSRNLWFYENDGGSCPEGNCQQGGQVASNKAGEVQVWPAAFKH